MWDAKSGWNFDVYAGKEYDLRDHITNMGLMDSTTGSVIHVSLNCLINKVCMCYRLASGAVLKLAPSLYGKGHIMYTDQFYTSLHLLPMLRQVELSGWGNVMSNRKYSPKQIINPGVQRAV